MEPTSTKQWRYCFLAYGKGGEVVIYHCQHKFIVKTTSDDSRGHYCVHVGKTTNNQYLPTYRLELGQ